MYKDDQPLHLWPYWREDKGYEVALKEYYPNSLAANSDLLIALWQRKSAERTIDAIMHELETKQESFS